MRVPRKDHLNIEDEFTTTISMVVVNGTSYPSYNISGNATERPLTESERLMRDNRKIKLLFTTEPHKILERIDSFCTCFFTIEFLVRLIVAPNRVKFWKSVMNIIDVLCVLPMWIKYIMLIYEVKIDITLLPVFFIIMMLRVLRICRVLRMARHYTGVKILLLALTASLQELVMLLIFVFIVILIFAVVIYYAEFFEDTTFLSIPQGYWWAIITLTTVGYGDMYPKSPTGYIVGSLCALTGILATGLPVPIIANNFNLYYTHTKLKDAVSNRRPSSKHKCMNESSSGIKLAAIKSKKETVIAKEASV
jgi:voltage-gated potassium channel Kch